MLSSAYRSLLTRNRSSSKPVSVWLEGAITALQGCFECTDWCYVHKCIEDVCGTESITRWMRDHGWLLRCESRWDQETGLSNLETQIPFEWQEPGWSKQSGWNTKYKNISRTAGKPGDCSKGLGLLDIKKNCPSIVWHQNWVHEPTQ